MFLKIEKTLKSRRRDRFQYNFVKKNINTNTLYIKYFIHETIFAQNNVAIILAISLQKLQHICYYNPYNNHHFNIIVIMNIISNVYIINFHIKISNKFESNSQYRNIKFIK